MLLARNRLVASAAIRSPVCSFVSVDSLSKPEESRGTHTHVCAPRPSCVCVCESGCNALVVCASLARSQRLGRVCLNFLCSLATSQKSLGIRRERRGIAANGLSFFFLSLALSRCTGFRFGWILFTCCCDRCRCVAGAAWPLLGRYLAAALSLHLPSSSGVDESTGTDCGRPVA